MIETMERCFNQEKNHCAEEKCFPSKPMHRHDDIASEFEIETVRDLKDYFYTSYLLRSLYLDQIWRWFSVFPRDQILVMFSEDFFDDSPAAMQRSSAFLGLDQGEERVFQFSNSSVFSKTWGGGASNAFDQPHSYAPLSASSRSALSNFYAPLCRRLSLLLGLSLPSSWPQ